MEEVLRYYNFFIQHGIFSSRKTIIETVIVVLLIITLLIFNKEKWSAREKVGRMAVWFYLYLIFLFTFLARSSNEEAGKNLLLFWSYQHIYSTHDFYIVLEVLINCLMFVPVGILVPWAYRNYLHEEMVRERNTVMLFGLIVSISVECLQLVTKTGFFEWDDIMHNMIGLVWGYGLFLWMMGKKFWEVHRYFLPMVAVGLALLITML
ncbi:VanZ family protein [Eubacteriaceae bacterium ES3]|nr:VanZ family protein [Eubacteriaceae bacterium ES3]